MKKFLISAGVIFFFSCTFVKAQEAPVKNPIINMNKVVNFGIWRVYNSGNSIYFVDQKEGNSLFVGVKMGKDEFRFSSTDGTTVLLFDGSIMRFGGKSWVPIEARTNESIGKLKNGRYGFGSTRFLVKENTITIFDVDNETESGAIMPATTLNKYANGVTYTGTAAPIIIDPTTVLDASDIVGSAVVLGDCLASYSGPEEIIIPCLSVEGSDTVYRVK